MIDGPPHIGTARRRQPACWGGGGGAGGSAMDGGMSEMSFWSVHAQWLRCVLTDNAGHRISCGVRVLVDDTGHINNCGVC